MQNFIKWKIRKIKRFEITRVIFKISEKSYRKMLKDETKKKMSLKKEKITNQPWTNLLNLG
jgi:hypothetical protein